MLKVSTNRFTLWLLPACGLPDVQNLSRCETASAAAHLRPQPQPAASRALEVWRCATVDASASRAVHAVQCPPVPPYSPLVRALDVWRCGCRPSSRAAGDSSRAPSSSAVSLELRLLAGKAVRRLPARAGASLSRRGGERCCMGLGPVAADVAMSSSVWWKMSCRVACRQGMPHIGKARPTTSSHPLLLSSLNCLRWPVTQAWRRYWFSARSSFPPSCRVAYIGACGSNNQGIRVCILSRSRLRCPARGSRFASADAARRAHVLHSRQLAAGSIPARLCACAHSLVMAAALIYNAWPTVVAAQGAV